LRASASQPLQDKTLPCIHKPRVVQDISDLMPRMRVEQMACSPSSTLLLTSDNRVFAWVSFARSQIYVLRLFAHPLYASRLPWQGENTFGQLGLGDTEERKTPTEIFGV
jgi:hypothetical protein